MSHTQPSKDDVVSSLAAAAEAAHRAYMAALAANPEADLSELYKAEMRAAAMWSVAEDQALIADPAVEKAQKDLDEATKNIRNQLGTLKDISKWIQLLDGLVKLATTVSKFFV
jgi:hypothetical protein